MKTAKDRFYQAFLIFLKIIRRRPKCIHCEAIFVDEVYELVKEFISRRKMIFFCLTPVNHNFVCGEFEPIDIDELEKKLKSRYSWLKENGIKIQLHVHTSKLPSKNSYEFQKRLIKEAKEWLCKQGFPPTELVLGWFDDDSSTKMIAEELGLKIIKETDYLYLHDYDLKNYLRGKVDWQ